ncbi:MAG TPA: hypothetical protein VL379_17285 [Pseudomonadales bacterium]|nr:hypothetical protein [Pseudomonadales bacterium]
MPGYALLDRIEIDGIDVEPVEIAVENGVRPALDGNAVESARQRAHIAIEPADHEQGICCKLRVTG